MSQDLRYAFRSFSRKPGFALAVIALTAVGIGATTAVFSVVDRVLFRDLPYARSGELVSLGIRIPWLEFDFLTAGTYQQLRRDPGPLAALTSWSGVADCDLTDDRPARLSCARVEASFLPVLGVTPAPGRNFTRDEDQPNVPRVALVSHALWKNRFGGTRAVLGRRLTLDGQQVQIVGVLPAEFELPTLDRADLVLPQALPPSLATGTRPLRIYGRLRNGVTMARARDAILARAQQLFEEVPPTMRKQVQFHVLGLRDMQTAGFRTASWTLLGAVLAMLGIACANAANLFLARSVGRHRELAIRLALGAGRWRIARQALTETLTLSAAGGLAGCALAYGLLRLFVWIAPAGIPHLAWASLDWRVLGFGIGVSLISGLAFGLAPALHNPALSLGKPATSPARTLLVAAQLAVSLVLLISAGVLLESLWKQQAVWLGIRTDRVVTAQVVLGTRYGEPASRRTFYEQLEARLARIPGIESVALSDSLPPGGVPRSQPIFAPVVEGRQPFDMGTPGIVMWRAVTPDYFRTLGIPIRHGRAFNEDDRRPTERSLILSTSYARLLFGDTDPIGHRMAQFPGSTRWYTVVGVAADARNTGLTDRNDPEYYVVRRHGAAEYQDVPQATSVIVRGGSPALLRTEIVALDPALPAVIGTFREHVGSLAARPRFQAVLLALFAGIGLLVAVFGVYGLVSFLVAQRNREIGIRLAMGARPSGIVRMILGDVLRWTAGGVIAGVGCAAAATHSLRSLLFHVAPADPLAYSAAGVILMLSAIAAALPPSYRASRVDPVTTLRQE